VSGLLRKLWPAIVLGALSWAVIILLIMKMV